MKKLKRFFQIDFTIYLCCYIMLALMVQFSTGKVYSPEQAREISATKLAMWTFPVFMLIFRAVQLGIWWFIKKIQTRCAE